jgi:hypothetical protein
MCIKECSLGQDSSSVRAISLTGQMQCLVVVSHEGDAICDAMLHTDRYVIRLIRKESLRFSKRGILVYMWGTCIHARSRLHTRIPAVQLSRRATWRRP